MVKNKINLSLNEPYIRQVYAKEGDSGRVYEFDIDPTPTENGTLRIKRPDGVEVTADAIKSASGDAYKGDLVTFDALEEVPLEKLEVDLEPIQDTSSGDPSPSNICPIYPSNGKNLSPTSVATTTSAGNINASSGSFGTVVSGQTYTISFVNKTPITSNLKVRINDGNTQTDQVQHNLVANGKNSYTFTASKDGTVVFNGSAGASYSSVVVFEEVQLEIGSVATSYAPYQGIVVVQTGKNLLDCQDATGGGTGTSLTKSSGTINIKNTSSYRYASFDFYRSDGIVASGKFPIRQVIWSFDVSGTLTTTWMAGLRAVSGNTFSSTYRVSFDTAGHYRLAFDLSALTEPMYLSASRTGNSTADLDVTFSNMQIELGSTATPYEPYNGSTYPLSLGQNVYGGKVDLVSGKLVVTHRYFVADGVNIKTTGGYGADGPNWLPCFVFSDANKAVVDTVGNVLSDTLKTVPSASVQTIENSCCIGNNGAVMVVHIGTMQGTDGTHGYNSANEVHSAMNTYLQSNPIGIWYKRATPTVIDLTPTQITTLLGENNVWSSGEVEVAFEYDGLFAQLPEEATEVVGRCIGDVNFNGVSTMPFTLVVQKDNKGV